MRSNRLITKGLAIVLLLVFTQKIGAGLYLHNWLHQKDCPGNQSYNAVQVSVACNCIDDFTLPINKPADPVIAIIAVPPVSFFSDYTSSLFFYSGFYSSLRGPPAA